MPDGFHVILPSPWWISYSVFLILAKVLSLFPCFIMVQNELKSHSSYSLVYCSIPMWHISFLFYDSLVFKSFGMELQNASPALVLQGSQQQSQCSATTATDAESKPKKIYMLCLPSCPDTKRLRDECIVERGESAWASIILREATEESQYEMIRLLRKIEKTLAN